MSVGSVDFSFQSSLVRGANGDLHVVYPRTYPDLSVGLSHTTIHSNGKTGHRT